MNLTPDDSIDEPLSDEASITAQSQGLSTVRVTALTDGVFAIVLTLLVLDLHAPAAISQMQLLSELREIVPQLMLFVVSFAIVAVFWYGHHMEMHWIVRSDRVHLGITLIFLLTISFVPFSASLLGKNPQLPLAATIYGTNLFLAGVVRYSLGVRHQWFAAGGAGPRPRLRVAH